MSRSLLNTFTLLALGTLIALTTACGKDSPTTPTPTSPTPTQVATRITITPASATLDEIGQTVQLTAQVFDQNNAVMTSASVTWTSRNSRIASVSTAGLVTAVKYGTTRIVAMSGNAVQDVEVKIVQTVGRITIEPTEAVLTAIGATVQLTATVQDRNGQTIEGANMTWQSSDTEVARVSSEGLVTAVNNGTARITARSGSTEQGITVRVMQTPTIIVVEPPETILTAFGETVQLMARVVDPNNQILEGARVTWQSSDAAVATVDADGLVTAVNNGAATITASLGDLSESSEVSVMQTPASIVIDPDETTLAAAGDTVQLTATVLDYKGHAIDGADVTWESGDETIATVDGQGLVTAVAGGTVEITARSGVVSSTSSITVKDVVLDREVLTILYQATNGDEWTNNENWLSDRPLNTWYGVRTNSDGEVVRLELSRNNLQGTIPIELCHLASLRLLALRRNNLTGNIPPELGLLTNLTWLELYDNALTGDIPPELGQLTELGILILGSNNLTGKIPPELGQLTRLQELGLLNIGLSGSIPPELGRMVDLKRLYLAGNELTGSIPPDLGQLANLTNLLLTGNELTGNIPPELGQLASLVELHLSSNRLTGEIPLELVQLTKLTSLDLAKNRLTGNIPPELSQLTELTHLDFGSNMLTGEIPPELGKLTRLESLEINRNALTGRIPPELGQLTNLKSLWFEDNRLAGNIPSELGQLVNLQALTLDKNRLTGTIPDELGQLPDLVFLWFANNPGLSGPLPDSFTNLENMRWLTLHNTGLCVPPTETFQTWIDGIRSA
ncbi:MAG: hypothetical protein F4207_07630, partial [Gemmatimonadetes bacterium]|nr:hypothetical protein [Gemmatimonadota bacterium]